MKRWLFSLSLILATGGVFAQEGLASSLQEEPNPETQLPIFGEDEESALTAETPRSAFSLLLELIVLLVVLAVIAYFVVWLLKKAQKANLGGEEKAIESYRVLGAQTLGKDKSLKIVELYSQVVVLSESPNGLQFLYEITDEDTKNRILLDFSKEKGKQAESGGTTFLSKWQDQFKQLTGSFAPKPPKKESGEENEKQDGQDFLETSSNRLKKL